MTKPPVKRLGGFARDAGGFHDPKKELFAKAWAKTGMLARACEAAGVTKETGAKWRGVHDMVTRIRELRAGGETFVGVSKAYIVNRLRENAENAAADGKFKESNDALEELYKIISKDPDMKGGEDQAVSGVHADMTPEELEEHRKKVFNIRVLPAPAERELVRLEDDGELIPVFGGVDEV